MPPQGPVLRSAFKSITTPIASATARIIINDTWYPSEFRVLSQSSHDIILGCDFLMDNEAIIDYVNGELFLSELPRYDAVVFDMPRKCHVESDTILMPQATSLVSLITDSESSPKVLLQPRRNALAKKGLIAPFCVVCVERKSVLLPITNCSMESIVLLEGFVAALFETEPCARAVAALCPLPTDTSSHIEARVPSDLNLMISEALGASERQQLISLLRPYSRLFDMDGDISLHCFQSTGNSAAIHVAIAHSWRVDFP